MDGACARAIYVIYYFLSSRCVHSFLPPSPISGRYLPLSKVDENMARAAKADAVLAEKFWFRADIRSSFKGGEDDDNEENGDDEEEAGSARPGARASDACMELTVAEILLGKDLGSDPPDICGTAQGKGGGLGHAPTDDGVPGPAAAASRSFPGLLRFVRAYLDGPCGGGQKLPLALRARVDEYLALVERRASGSAPTAAAWCRRFVRRHPAYARDSVVSSEVAFDLLERCSLIGAGSPSAARDTAELLGPGFRGAIEPVLPTPEALGE